MKKILMSVMTVGLVSAALVYTTSSYFTDTEAVVDNSFSTGTIDISVDDQNSWESNETFTIEDLKPSQHEYSEMMVKNVGSNPVNLWKELSFHDHSNLPVSEPECGAEGGLWSADECSDNQPVTDLENVTNYDMSVYLYDENDTLVWWQMIFNEEVTMASAYGNGPVYLGMIPAGWSMKVEQSYHMPETVGNAYQGDSMQYDVTLTASQLTGTVYLENKDQNNPEIDSWKVLGGDSKKGELKYTVKDKTFDFKFSGVAPLSNTEYYLIAYSDPYGSTQITLGSGLSDGSGNIAIAGDLDLNQDLINKKIWLVPAANYNPGTQTLVGWAPENYLFELGLMDYYDSLLP